MSTLKYKYIVAVFLVGFAGKLLGQLFKITHAPHADTILTISSFVMIGSIVAGILKVIRTKDTKSFLNH